MIRSLKSYYEYNKEAKAAGYGVFETTPTTFLVSLANKDENSLQAFTHRFQEISKGYCRREKTPAKHCEENIWLVKPENANQGRGIEVFRNLRDI